MPNRWRRLLPFLRIAPTCEPSEPLDSSLVVPNDPFLASNSNNLTRWGCRDELGVAACNNLPGLFEADGTTCRWPSAELCLSTCGFCPLVESARHCTSLPEEIDERLRHESMDWAAFFHNITSLSNQERHPHLRGARILNSKTPWVAEFPNYLTETEADEVIRLAAVEGYRIEDEYPNHIRDVNVTNCDSIRCMRQPFISELYRRASQLIGLHPNNFESMEFIDYGPGQHYRWHADEYSWKNGQDFAAVLSGPRLLTMFYYLSDVEEGGETAFAGPDSSGKTKRLAVTPEKGKVILWANMQDDFRKSDSTAVHSALPVRRGRKLAGTLWIHASGFRIPELYAGRDCNPRYA